MQEKIDKLFCNESKPQLYGSGTSCDFAETVETFCTEIGLVILTSLVKIQVFWDFKLRQMF